MRAQTGSIFPQRRASVGSGAANAVSLHDPSRENGIAERPQALRYPEIINILSAIYAQSNAERIQNRPLLPVELQSARFRQRLPLGGSWQSRQALTEGVSSPSTIRS